MSGHNPHGRLGQPNSSWNHLQVPSYIPRQPQLAHMSNERPLTWHTPTPPEALYSFMAANHKNPLELNPLLPTFVRAPSAPFGSVDLTIPSAARNSSTPSPRSLHSPGIGSNIASPPDFSIIQTAKSAANNINRSSISPSPGVIQTTASVKEKMQNSSNGGNNGEISLTATTTATTGGLYIRDAKQINSDVAKLSREPIGLPLLTEPVELVKEAIYHSMKNHTVPMSPQCKSPTQPSSTSRHSPIRSGTPPSILNQQPNDLSAASIVNNHMIQSSVAQHQQQQQFHNSRQLSQLSLSAPFPPRPPSVSSQASPTSNSITSNEDSVDSSGVSKKRRKRKPNKTVRMSNDDDIDDDEFSHSIGSCSNNSSNGSGKSNIGSCGVEKNVPSLELNSVPIINNDKISIKNNTGIVPERQPVIQETINDLNKIPTPIATTNIESDLNLAKKTDQQKSLPLVNSNENFAVPIQQQILRDTPTHQSQTAKNVILPPPSPPLQPSCPLISVESTKSKENLAFNIPQINTTATNLYENATEAINTKIGENKSPKKKNKRKTDSDDAETIDKIAAMIASTAPDSLDDSDDKLKGNNDIVGNVDLEKSLKSDKIEEITDEIKETKGVLSVVDIDNKDVKENSFEEIENKLEEMFAGIEDDRPIVPDVSMNSLQINEDIMSASSTKSDILLQSDATLNASSKSSKSKKRPSKDDDDYGPNIKKKKPAKKQTKSLSKKQGSKKQNSNKQNKSVNKEKSKLKDESQSVESNLSKYRGPYVQVKRDGSIAVINTPQTEDDPEKAQNKIKGKKSIHSHNSKERNKIRGLHVSTLSMKYDADTTDKTWMCVFCKLGPHKMGLGDLFGPYIITTTCEEFQLSQVDPINDEFKSKRTKLEMIQKNRNFLPIVAASNVALNNSPENSDASGTSTTGKKKKKSIENVLIPTSPTTAVVSPASALATISDTTDAINIYYGMSKVSETSYEVWLHEDCTVWASGVHIIGARVVGLEAAVWGSSRHKCTFCSNYGAMLSCLQRGCHATAHIPCARRSEWTLNDNDFKSRCDKHNFNNT